MTESLTIKGVPELTRALGKFNQELVVRVQRQAFRNGANYMKQQLKSATPVKSGLAKNSIRVATSKINTPRKNGKVGVWVGWRKVTGNRRLKGRATKATAYYIGWVEYGYNRGSKKVGASADKALKAIAGKNRKLRRARLITRHGGKAIPGQHFAEITFDRHVGRSIDIIVNLSNVITKQLAAELGFKV